MVKHTSSVVFDVFDVFDFFALDPPALSLAVRFVALVADAILAAVVICLDFVVLSVLSWVGARDLRKDVSTMALFRSHLLPGLKE